MSSLVVVVVGWHMVRFPSVPAAAAAGAGWHCEHQLVFQHVLCSKDPGNGLHYCEQPAAAA